MADRATPPEFLVVGHVVQDLPPEDGGATWRYGGAASYASKLAQRLGLRTAILTAAAPGLPLEQEFPGIEIARAPSQRTTLIRNTYTDEGRVQYIPERAADIGAGSLPEGWRGAGIVLLGPMVGEIDPALATCFPEALVGIAAQGWLRDIAADGRVRPLPPASWQGDAFLETARALFVSDEDLAQVEARRVLDGWARRVEIVAYTRGSRGAEVCHDGTWRHIDAFPAGALDVTGAGDVFAAAFLVRYRETGDVWEAARFAACAASFIVEGTGQENTPDRATIESRLRAHPGIVAG
ncbi:MAG: PfkB family carbohydrate kinase [Dehalococcoidia bacterium]